MENYRNMNWNFLLADEWKTRTDRLKLVSRDGILPDKFQLNKPSKLVSNNGSFKGKNSFEININNI